MPYPEDPSGLWLRAACSGAAPDAWPELEPDAERALALARRHRLTACVGARLAELGGVQHAWSRHFISAWRRCLGEQALIAATLGELAEDAAGRGLPMIALKGADLASRVYAPGERESNDIDLLVPPRRLEETEAVLEGRGFRCDHPEPLAARRHWFASTYRSLERPRLQIDLHWGLGTPGRVRWQLSALFARSEEHATVPGLRRLSWPDLVVYLALHAVAFHGAAGRWVWWLDLHRLLEERLLDRRALVERAREVGGDVALRAGLARAGDLFAPGRALPLRLGARARLIRRLGARYEDRPATRSSRWLVAALAVDRLRDLPRVGWGVLSRGVDPS